MDNKWNPREVTDNIVVTLEYTLQVDGEVVDSSRDGEPIQFIQGHGQIIPGLESELYGMSVGEHKDVTITPENGYGIVDPENYADIPRAKFPNDIPLEPGVELEVQDQDGEVMEARIVSVDPENVRLDFNHPLAGKELHFSVDVLELRQPTADELTHGHVHDNHHGGDEEFEEDEE